MEEDRSRIESGSLLDDYYKAVEKGDEEATKKAFRMLPPLFQTDIRLRNAREKSNNKPRRSLIEETEART